MVVLCLFGLTINNAFAQTNNPIVEKQIDIVLGLNTGDIKNETAGKSNEYFMSSSESEDTLETIEESGFGLYQFENHTKTNYFISPSLIPLDKGEISLRNIMVGNNNLSYGVSKHITLSAGVDAFSLVSDDVKPIWNLSGKIGFEAARNVRVGGGFNYRANSIYDLSMVYGGLTLGNANHNFTLGAGFDIQSGSLSDKPAYSFSGMFRLDDNILLVSENFWVDREGRSKKYEYMGVHGIRYMNTNSSVDIGVMKINASIPFIYEGRMFLPYVGCKINVSEYLKKIHF